MKTTLLAAAAATAALFVAAPSFAGDFYTPNGFVGADYTYDHVSVSGLGGQDVNNYGVSGSTNVKLNSVLNLQLDADYSHADLSHYSSDNGGGDAHLFVRNEGGAYGLVGGARSVDNVILGDFGAEAARFYDKFTVLGDVKTNWTDTTPRFHLTTFDLGGRYYVTDNFRIDAGASYDRPSIRGKYSNGWGLNVGGEYRLAKLPASVYAKFEYADLNGEYFPVKDTAVHVGIRWNFDGSLKARERSGATFAPTGPDLAERLASSVF
jgi:hypothetical protein